MAHEAKKPSKLMKDVVKDASLLAEHRKMLGNLRADDDREWLQNKEFYRGNQYIQWSNTTQAVQNLNVDESVRPRYKVRLVANAVQPGVQGLAAQMTKTKPTIHAVPSSGADRDVKAAQMAEALYEHWWSDLGLKAKLTSAIVNAQISQGYWLITWDAHAGKSMKVMVNPEDGSPIWDDEMADIYRETLRNMESQNGLPQNTLVDQYEQTVNVGDIRVQVLDGMCVWLDPTPNNVEECKYAICKFPMTVDEIQAVYGKTVSPNASSADRRPAAMYQKKSYDDDVENVREVFAIYHKPTAWLPRGAYVVWTEGPNEILLQSDYVFPFRSLPLVKFPGIERPGSVYDEVRTTSARPMQKELNDIVSGIAMHRRMTSKPQLLAATGSLRQRLTDEPGAVIEFNPIAGLTPQWRPIPPLPSYINDNLQDTQRRLDKVYNLVPSERSNLPARTDSGHLVQLVQEAVADQISPEIQRMEIALAEAGGIMVAYAQEYYTEPRLLRIKGPGGSVQVSKFMNVDLAGEFSFQTEAGSGLPQTREGKIQAIKEMVEMGILDPHEAAIYMPLAGLRGIQQRQAVDEDFAYRKVEKLTRGVPLNIPAMEAAIQQVMTTGINPTTGSYFASPEEAQAFVTNESLRPLSYENIKVSMNVVALKMKSSAFDTLPPEVQQRFTTAFDMMQQMLQDQAQAAQPAEVRTSLNLSGTVGPTVAAGILARKGIMEATPETMSEAPLETSVYDSMDKVDADDAGNDPLTTAEQLMTMQQSQSQSDLRSAKAVHQLASAQHGAESSAMAAAQKLRHAEETHQARLLATQQASEAQPADKG